MKSDENYLVTIQYLRAIAALMVVLHHARNKNGWLFNPLEGYSAFSWGVDIFFVISGFIMFVAARQEHYVDFMGKRIIRVVPLYWLATLTLLLINTNFNIWQINLDTFVRITQSLFFIPHYYSGSSSNIWPYLIPGWTLNYEMLFYLIFFVGLLVKRTLFISTIIILVLFFIGVIFNPESVILKAYTKPILLEFLCGIWIAWAYTKGFFNRTQPLVIIVGFIALLILPFVSMGNFTIIGRIIASSLIIVGALLLGKYTLNSKLLHLLGDASYSIYLTHAVISLRYSSKVMRNLPLEGWIQFSIWIILALVVSSIIGIIVHLYIEKPIIRLLRSKWELAIRKNK